MAPKKRDKEAFREDLQNIDQAESEIAGALYNDSSGWQLDQDNL